MNRQRFLDIVCTRYSAIYQWTFYCYSVGAPYLLTRISSSQRRAFNYNDGDPLRPVLFALVLQPFLQQLRDVFSLRLGAILDETFFGSSQAILQAMEFLGTSPLSEDMRLVPCWSPHAFTRPFFFS